ERAIPLSPGNYNKKIHLDHTAERIAELTEHAERDGVDLTHSPKWREQLGSLGGGNHFIELCIDEMGRVWCFLHSGSRGVGNKIAQKHIRIAQQQCAEAGIELPHRDHAYLREGTPEFDQYIAELHWAQSFALANREEMMDRFVDQLARATGEEAAVEVERLNTHHNYTEPVEIGGRPGPTPGSMRAGPHVTRAKGDTQALWPARHGAGRVLSRRAAKQRYTAEDLDQRMSGLVYRPGPAWGDGSPDAYKPIDQVMA